MAKLTREEVIARVERGESLDREDLSGLDLNITDLRSANLSRANLSNASLISAALSRANLWAANLNSAYLRSANLSNANLTNADLLNTTLFSANLRSATLFSAGLSCANLSSADLFDAKLNNANLGGANLTGANLRESDLSSANLEGADLSGADLTGANIWNIATADRKIEGVKCEYAYNCKNWENKKELEKTRRDFAPGEFEQIYKSFPKLELIFKEEFSHLDHRALLAVIDRINRELPTAHLNMRKIERTGQDTTATLTAVTSPSEFVGEIAEKIPEHYAGILDELREIKKLLVDQKPKPLSPLPDWLTQLKEITGQPTDRILNPPSTIIIMNQPQDFILPTAPTYGQLQKVSIQYQTQIINNFLDHLDESSEFDDAKLASSYQELQDHYDKLDEQGKKDLLKLIAEKANKNPGIMEKLKEYGKWGAKEGWDIGKAVITSILTECAKGL